MSGSKTRRASVMVRKPAGGHSVSCAAGAGQARRIGRVDEIVPRSDLLAVARAHAAAVAGNAPLAVRAATDREIAGQQWLMLTDDFERGRGGRERAPARRLQGPLNRLCPAGPWIDRITGSLTDVMGGDLAGLKRDDLDRALCAQAMWSVQAGETY